MCEPTTIAYVAALVISTAVGVKGQKDTADYQNKVNNNQRTEAILANAENNNQINMAQEQQRQQASNQIAQNNLAARNAFSTAQVAAGESGISGLSVDALLGDILGQQSQFNESVETNYMGQVMANENERRNSRVNAANIVNSLPGVTPPDYLGAGLRIGSAAMTGYNAYGDHVRSGMSATTSTDTNYGAVDGARPYASSIGSKYRQ